MHLEQQISRLTHGDHVCMIYENVEEQVAAAVPFIRHGLERNDCCVYITDDRTMTELRTGLARGGVRVEREIARGALSLLTKREAYLRSATFDPQEMIEFLRQTVDGALARGFTGFRVTGEMTWALGCECGCDRLIEYEARLNHFFPGSRAMAICQYNRQRFTPQVIHDVLRTHPQAVVGKYVCTNLYYEPPELILENDSMATKVEWMLGQLKTAREAEMQLMDFNTALEAKVAEKTLSLEEAREQLRNFCHMMAHDLRSPLRAIEAYAGAALEEPPGALGAQAREYLNRMRKAAGRMQSLITDLLSFAQVLDKEVALEPVALGPLLENLSHELLEHEGGRNATIRVDRSSAVVAGHLSTLASVFQNLMSNALKFVPRERSPVVDVTVRETGRHVEVRVRDNGTGLPPDAAGKLFQPFERFHGNEFPGTGMGLAIVRKGVERLGGTITVETAPGAGTTFIVQLAKP